MSECSTGMSDGRSALKQGQIDILELLYKYRFGSRQLLADSLGMKPDSLYRKLEVLIKHGYIKARLEKRLKLLGTPTAYYLTPKGLRTLAALPDHEYITDSVIKGSYKDGTVTQSFITQTLRVYAQTNQLKAFYPSLKVFLRRDMNRYSYFPKPLPDAFLSLKTDTQPKRFFLDSIPDSLPSKPLYQRITRYAEFFDEGGWEVVGDELPILLLIGETGTTERRLRRLAISALNSADSDEDITVYTTTSGAVQNVEGEGAIWTNLDDSEELRALPDLR
jgi:DNA-binding PadR family transcriptional regulator